MRDGRPMFAYAYSNQDGAKYLAEDHIEKTVPFRFSREKSFDTGEDTGTPVIAEYDPQPCPFTGIELDRVEFRLGTYALAGRPTCFLRGPTFQGSSARL